MGLVSLHVDVANPADATFSDTVEMLVDTGAVPSVIPRPVLVRLGVTPQGKRRFRLADGQEIEREYGEVRFSLAGEQATSRVVFGEPADAVVLGVLALESMGVSVDPSTGTVRREEVQLLVSLR